MRTRPDAKRDEAFRDTINVGLQLRERNAKRAEDDRLAIAERGSGLIDQRTKSVRREWPTHDDVFFGLVIRAT